MADAAMFRSGMRACGLGVTDFAELFDVPISNVRTWRKRGAPEHIMQKLGDLYFSISETDCKDMKLPDGCWSMVNFLMNYRHHV